MTVKEQLDRMMLSSRAPNKTLERAFLLGARTALEAAARRISGLNSGTHCEQVIRSLAEHPERLLGE